MWVLPKQFFGQGRAGWFAISLPAVVRTEICNFFSGAGDSLPTLLEGHRGIFNVQQLMSADGEPFNIHPTDGTHIDETPYL